MTRINHFIFAAVLALLIAPPAAAAEWKQAVEKNRWIEDYRNSAAMGKELRRQYDILKDVLNELGMVK